MFLELVNWMQTSWYSSKSEVGAFSIVLHFSSNSEATMILSSRPSFNVNSFNKVAFQTMPVHGTSGYSKGSLWRFCLTGGFFRVCTTMASLQNSYDLFLGFLTRPTRNPKLSWTTFAFTSIHQCPRYLGHCSKTDPIPPSEQTCYLIIPSVCCPPWMNPGPQMMLPNIFVVFEGSSDHHTYYLPI